MSLPIAALKNKNLPRVSFQLTRGKLLFRKIPE